MDGEDFAEDSVVVDKIRHFLEQIVMVALSISLYCLIFLQNFSNNLFIFHDFLIDFVLRDLLLDVSSKVILNLGFDVLIQHTLLELLLPEKFKQNRRDYREEFGVK